MVDVKREIHDAYGLFHLQRDGGGGDPVSGRIYGMAKAVWAGKVMAAVENQPKPLGDVLLVCYAPDTVPSETNFKNIQQCLVGHILARHEVKQHRVLIKLRALAEVGVIAYRRQSRGFGPMPDSMIYTMAGLQKQNWHDGNRPWRRWWNEMGQQMHRWHREALTQPERVCREIQETREPAASGF